MPWISALLMLALLTGTAWAQGSARERLAAERQILLDRFSVEERACREGFVVTACTDALRVRRRAALAPLRERELALMDAERQQRAIDHQAARAARPLSAGAGASQPVGEPETGGLPSPPPAMAIVSPMPMPMPTPTRMPAVRDADLSRTNGVQTSYALHAAERARAAAKRAELIDARQAEQARRNVARAAAGKPPVALPTPAALAGSAAAR